MRSTRLLAAALAAIAGAAGSAALGMGCSDVETATGGAGGAPDTTSQGGSAPVCPTYDDLDAGADAPAVIVTPAADDEALCTALAQRAEACHPGCPPEPQEPCALGWACLKKALRPDMLADIYACLPTVPCDSDEPLLAPCVSKLRDKYPPSAAQLAYEDASAQFAEACSGGAPSVCADGACGGMIDAYYEAATSCLTAKDDCLGAAICIALVQELQIELPCTDLGQGDAGAPDGG